MKPWFIWKFKGVGFIAVPNNDGVSILDETGKWYGSFMSVESFRERQGKPDEWLPLDGVGYLAVRVREAV